MVTHGGNTDFGGAKEVLQHEAVTPEFRYYFFICEVLTENAHWNLVLAILRSFAIIKLKHRLKARLWLFKAIEVHICC